MGDDTYHEDENDTPLGVCHAHAKLTFVLPAAAKAEEARIMLWRSTRVSPLRSPKQEAMKLQPKQQLGECSEMAAQK